MRENAGGAENADARADEVSARTPRDTPEQSAEHATEVVRAGLGAF